MRAQPMARGCLLYTSFQYGLVDEFMREWLFRQQELHAGEITRDEYFEWKLNWPHTCDDSKESEYYIPWRKNK